MNITQLRPRMNPDADHFIRFIMGLFVCVLGAIMIGGLVALVIGVGWWAPLIVLGVLAGLCFVYFIGTVMDWIWEL